MPSPVETVEAFLAEWAKSKEAMLGSIRTYFTPTTIWENVGMMTTTGPDEALAVMETFEAAMGVVTIRVENIAIAAQGNKVLTERIDYNVRADGSEAMAVRLMGIFEVEDGKITAWRDYFDTAAVSAH